MKLAGSLLVLLGVSFPLAVAAAGTEKAPPSLTAGVVKQTLPNGLRVLVLPRHTTPVVTTMMWYRVGSKDELPGATGLAHFLEHLMFKGTRKLKKGEIDRLTYQNGGSNNAFTFNDYTAYEFNFPKQTWKVALSIEADRMRNCSFDTKEFDAERQVVMEERRIGEDEPAQQFQEQLNAISFVAHPYRNPVIGWMADLKRVSRDEVYAFYQQYYRPSNATLVITGDVTPQEALATARAAFQSVLALPAPQRRAVVEPPPAAGTRRLTMTLPTQVARFAASFHVPTRKNPDVYALHVLQYALTEGKLSRLYQRLVDRDQLAADVDSGLGIYEQAGECSIYANAREGVSLDRIEGAIWDETRRLGAEPLTAAELERAKNQFYADWIDGLDTANDLATVLGEADALGGYQYLDTLVARVQAVTAADVQRVARTYLREDRAVVGDLLPQRPGTGSQGAGTASSGAFRSAPASAAFRTLGIRPWAFASAGCARSAKAGVVAASGTFAPLHPTEKVLPNGLRLVLLEKHDLPTVTFSTRINAGAYQDPEGLAGLAEMAARMLEEGTRSRSHAEISEALEQVGATFGAAAGRETSSATLQTLSRYAAELLPLYAELLSSPSFPSDRLDQERSRVLVELKEEADDAATVARKAFNRLVYAGHPAGRPSDGTEESVRAFTREALERFHQHYYRPDAATLVVVGDFRTAELLPRLTEVLGAWKSEGRPEKQPLPPVSRQQEVRKERLSMDKAQTQIVLGHLGVTRGNPDYLALKVMDTILGEGVGGGFTARIPYQLRDVQGLAYGVGSSITRSAAKEPGVFVAALGTEPKNEQKAVAALLTEIRKIRAAPVTETELREAENYLANSYVFDFQTNAQLAGYLDAVQYFGLGYNYRREFVERVRKVTRADVLRVAQKYLDPQHYTLVVVAPPQK
jgi:zinc protease